MRLGRGERGPRPPARSGTEIRETPFGLGPPPPLHKPPLTEGELRAWEWDLRDREARFAAHVADCERRFERFLDRRVETLSDALTVVSVAFPQGLRIEARPARALH